MHTGFLLIILLSDQTTRLTHLLILYDDRFSFDCQNVTFDINKTDSSHPLFSSLSIDIDGMEGLGK